MDIRSRPESDAKEYYSHLSIQEQQKKAIVSQSTTRTLEPNNIVSCFNKEFFP